MKKLLTLILSVVITVSLSLPVYAHNFPSDINDWTKKDWKKWNKMCEEYWEEHKDGTWCKNPYKVYWQNGHYIPIDPNNNCLYNNHADYNYWYNYYATSKGVENQIVTTTTVTTYYYDEAGNLINYTITYE